MTRTDSVFVSMDVETDGPIPGKYSMLQLGAVAFDGNGRRLSKFVVNLERLPAAGQHPDTMLWWSERQEIYEKTRFNLMAPAQAMKDFAEWLETLPSPLPVAVCYPATFDFMFVYWYLINFNGHSPFSFAALDLKTLAWAMLNRPFRKIGKRHMPRKWLDGTTPHSHDALDDAHGQGQMLFNMLRDLDSDPVRRGG